MQKAHTSSLLRFIPWQTPVLSNRQTKTHFISAQRSANGTTSYATVESFWYISHQVRTAGSLTSRFNRNLSSIVPGKLLISLSPLKLLTSPVFCPVPLKALQPLAIFEISTLSGLAALSHERSQERLCDEGGNFDLFQPCITPHLSAQPTGWDIGSPPQTDLFPSEKCKNNHVSYCRQKMRIISKVKRGGRRQKFVCVFCAKLSGRWKAGSR